MDNVPIVGEETLFNIFGERTVGVSVDRDGVVIVAGGKQGKERKEMEKRRRKVSKRSSVLQVRIFPIIRGIYSHSDKVTELEMAS